MVYCLARASFFHQIFLCYLLQSAVRSLTASQVISPLPSRAVFSVSSRIKSLLPESGAVKDCKDCLDFPDFFGAAPYPCNFTIAKSPILIIFTAIAARTREVIFAKALAPLIPISPIINSAL